MSKDRPSMWLLSEKNMKSVVKDFYIGEAKYYLRGEHGALIKLMLNYQKNTYTISVLNGNNKDNIKVRREARKVAGDLLGRKSNINLAKKLKEKGILK